MKHVIIGNSTAAVGAVEGIRKSDQDSSITVISSEPHHTYSRPLISYYLAGKVDSAGMAYRPPGFYQENKVTTLLGKTAESIDVEGKTVRLSGGKCIAYDRLLVATGSRPSGLDIEGITKKNVFSFYTLDDSRKLQHYIRPEMTAVVLGAGLTALKAAEALVLLGVKTTLVVRSRILRNFLDTKAAEKLTSHLKHCGLHLVCGSEPEAVLGKSAAEAVQLRDGRVLPCDLVISSIGIQPNTEIVRDKLETDYGILVDQGMRTSAEHIYAAGDVAQGYDLLAEQRRVIPLLPVAYGQGEVAGRNMAGETAVYTGMGMNAVSFFGLPVISAGQIEANEGEEVSLSQDAEGGKIYRKLVFRENRLTGYVLMDEIDRAGILTWLIREKIDVTSFKESLLAGTFNHAHLPEEVRRKKLAVAG
ncbi:NAD(P)/FAD-dependent oxidoreductase [Dethiobacter alkaliphilus]|uniref:NAD(P)/FAD-dependent oxidoreductase n=1 Tax=Dethiobacter alkaliphilus TaxID=427926 RepID=UPI002225DFE6|nr:FAD-dependent oxidoreductase [Dethiobacter alkaliphilus]MCW3489670.1 FAD-dependent oxidoreductase [Dethiobacter alkaliphilus]